MRIIDDAGRMNDFKASTSHSGTLPQATLRSCLFKFYQFFTFYLWTSHAFYYCLRCHRQQGCDGHHKDFPTTHTILQGVWSVTVRLASDDAVQSLRGMVFCFIAFWSKIKPAICIFCVSFVIMQVKYSLKETKEEQVGSDNGRAIEVLIYANEAWMSALKNILIAWWQLFIVFLSLQW